jgi:hypothetical protein
VAEALCGRETPCRNPSDGTARPAPRPFTSCDRSARRSPAAGAHPRDRLLRVAEASGRQAALPFRAQRFRAFRLCGLWEFARLDGEETLSDTIIVGEPNPLVAGVHDRMPVMLMPDDYDRWLDAGTSIEEARSLLRPYDPDLMKAYAVSRAVNSVKNDTVECIDAIEDSAKMPSTLL